MEMLVNYWNYFKFSKLFFFFLNLKKHLQKQWETEREFIW